MTKRWTYGQDGIRYPVQTGELWRVGPHTVACGDLMNDAGHALLQRAFTVTGLPTLIYADPPWNQGMLNSFHTKANRQHASYHIFDLYRRVASIADVPLWIESGRREGSQVAATLPGPTRKQFNVTYYKKHPSLLHYSGSVEPPVNPTGYDDEDTPALVLSAYPTGVVCDPCTGRGLTAVTAASLGWTFAGLELSPFRVSVTLSKLQRHVGAAPEKI